jgi:hypothetical protein
MLPTVSGGIGVGECSLVATGNAVSVLPVPPVMLAAAAGSGGASISGVEHDVGVGMRMRALECVDGII